MAFIDPLARQLEHFIYERVCALSELVRSDRGGAGFRDSLASPFDSSEARANRNRR